jgi:HD-GYP domain-containing protein (c-di-GMP phosphodiesterase class II)
MSRTSRSIILAFSGLTLLFAAVFAVYGWRLALGGAAVTGSCAVWAALMSTTHRSADVVTPELAATDSRGIEPSECVVTAEQIPIPTSTEPSVVLAAILSSARSAGDPVAAHLWLEDVGTPTLRLICAEGSPVPETTPVPSSEGVLAGALASGVVRCERFSWPAAGGADAPGWRYVLPLLTDQVRGVAVVDFLGESEPDLVEMARIASALQGSLAGSLALHVARFEACSARELLETVSELTRLLDAEDVVSAALSHALVLSGADTGSVMLLDTDGGSEMRIAEARGLPEDVVTGTRVRQGEGIAGWVLASGRPLVVEDLENMGPQSRRHGILSAASVPIADDDGVLGVLNVGSRRFHARFSKTHVRALEAVGRITAVALRNARASGITQDLFFDTLKALALSLETRDPFSRGGTERVLEVAVSIGEAMGIGESDADALKLAALLHDIGMSAAGESVAVTNRSLTTVERGLLKMHPQIASEILSQAPALGAVIPIVYHHHEHYDGSGYADGLGGEGIPLGARILSVADAYVAMTSGRPYRLPMPSAEAVAELEAGAGSQFDPEVVAAFIGLLGDHADRFALHSG